MHLIAHCNTHIFSQNYVTKTLSFLSLYSMHNFTSKELLS